VTFSRKRMADGEKKKIVKCHFLPNLHSDPTLLNAHIGACKGLRWNEVKGQKPYLVLSENSEVVCGGGALGACRGASSVTKVDSHHNNTVALPTFSARFPVVLSNVNQGCVSAVPSIDRFLEQSAYRENQHG
jgi:hypothetical protein